MCPKCKRPTLHLNQDGTADCRSCHEWFIVFRLGDHLIGKEAGRQRIFRLQCPKCGDLAYVLADEGGRDPDGTALLDIMCPQCHGPVQTHLVDAHAVPAP